jgi:uncharacterized protein YbjT (DUF2867 family)
MTAPILVTGATGTIGHHLVAHLAAAGHPVRALVRDPSKTTQFDPAVEVVIADLLDPPSLPAAFDGANTVFVLAPPTPDLEAIETNAFIAAEQARAQHIVYLSNFGAGRFNGPLFAAHGANEWRLRSLNTSWTILRPVRFMTDVPFAWTVIQRERVWREPLGGHPIVMIDPLDVAAAAALTLTSPGHEHRIYELTGPALSGTQVAQHLSEALGTALQFEDSSDDDAVADLHAADVPAPVIEALREVFRTVRDGHWYQTSSLQTLLGYPPRTFADFLRRNHATMTAKM